MPNLHPAFVHFPIALLTISLVADFAGKVLGNESLVKTGWWTLLLGFLGLALAIMTGLLARGNVQIPLDAVRFLDSHEQIAFIVTSFFGFLLFWRINAKRDLPRHYSWGYIALSLVGVVLMWIGAWHGGEMVYRFGVGVAH